MKKFEPGMAAEIMSRSEQIGASLSDLGEMIRQSSDHDFRQTCLRAIGEMMSSIYLEIQRPVAKDYPELHPDKRS